MLLNLLILFYWVSLINGSCLSPVNKIEAENCLTGTSSTVWDISTESSTIEGFADEFSVNVGETVNFKIKTQVSSWTIDIYRLGYYQNNGARLVTSIVPTVVGAQNQFACIVDATTGLTDCGNWETSASWAVPLTAVSGYYIALIKAGTNSNHIHFLVRDDSSTSDIVFQATDTTWQAYNSYSPDFYSLGTPTCTASNYPSCRGYKVSYNRPIKTRFDGSRNDFIFVAEYPMLKWLERNAYDVTYIAGVDTDRRGNLLLNHKMYMSNGHDEYWSNTQRLNVEAAREAGVHLAFFSSNAVYWKTRFEDSIDGSGKPYKTLVCYKETWTNSAEDPAPGVWTGTWRDPTKSPPKDGGRPENALKGTLNRIPGGFSGTISVPQADGQMRMWRNTALATLAVGASYSLTAGGLGEELDADEDNGFRPPGMFHMSTTLAESGYFLLDYGSTTGSGTMTHALTMFRHSSGALVFSSNTYYWAWGLEAYHDGSGVAPDRNIQQATVNLFADMNCFPGSLQSDLIPATKSTDVTPPVSVISVAAGSSFYTYDTVIFAGTATDIGGKVAGIEVSTDGGSTWHPAKSGRDSWIYDWIPVPTETLPQSVTLKSRAVDDSGNIETPSAGVTVVIQNKVLVPGTSYSLFTSYPVPTTFDTQDTSSVELGLVFFSEVAGYINAIRFYKGPTFGTAATTGSLWSITGTLLGTATFPADDSTSGWKQANLASPVAIAGGTNYVVSYHAPNGNYAYQLSAFSTIAFDTFPLHAPMSSTSVLNGRFVYASTAIFPTLSYQASNYFVDVVYSTDRTSDAPSLVPTYTPTLSPAVVASVYNTYSLFSAQTVVPTTPANDNGSVELGMLFKSDISGLITAIRYYKVSTNPATAATTGALWSITGTLLGTVTFPAGDITTGWKQASLVTPYLVTAGTTYVVSYHAPAGQYAAAGTFSNAGVDNIPLHSPQTNTASAATLNGRYLYSAIGSFPTDSYQGSNYFVDIVLSVVAPTATPSVSPTSTPSSLRPSISPTVETSAPSYVPSFRPTAIPSYSPSVPPSTIAPSSEPLLTPNPSQEPSYVPSIEPSYSHTPTESPTDSPSFGPSSEPSYIPSEVPTALPSPSPTSAPSITPTSSTSVPTSSPTLLPGSSYSLFDSSIVPATIGSGAALELGTQFYTEVNGYATAIRFYKGPNFGTLSTTGSLWLVTGATTGAFLGSVAFSGNDSNPGWKQASFTTPIYLTANTQYVVSYTAPSGNYAYSNDLFTTSSVDNYPLHAPQAGNGNINGRFREKAAVAFPFNSFLDTCYFVDILFTIPSQPPSSSPTITFNPTSQPADSVAPTNAPTKVPGLYSFFDSSTIPVTFATSDNAANELGMQFRVDVSGFVTAIKFYKGPTFSVLAHKGSLWQVTSLGIAGTGILLGDVTFPAGDPTTGWKEASFLTPVPITAGIDYVVSYFAPAGQYAYQHFFFTANDFDVSPLHAPKYDTSDTGNVNGRYIDNSPESTFPSLQFRQANYFVDVVFYSGSVAPTESPTFGSTVVPTESPITVAPSRPTRNPTSLPSVRPTKVPTSVPSFRPTNAPVFQPTKNPTPVPSFRPTKVPTSLPSVRPTKAPVFQPTKNPTPVPSVRPTQAPVFRPTKNPTSVPSVRPTNAPATNSPTAIPSVRPTNAPVTKSPTDVPSVRPTTASAL